MRKYYYIGVFIIIILAIYVRLASGFEPIIDTDVEGYLYPAHSWIKNHVFIHLSGRAFPYPLFCALILTVSKSYRAITISQNILGIFSLIILASLFRKWILYLRAPIFISHALALTLLLCIALLPQEIIFENYIRPEAIIGFFFCVFSYMLSVFLIDNNTRPYLVTILILFNSFLYFLFPRWGFCLPFVFLLIGGYCFFNSRKGKMFIYYFIGLILSFFLLYLPEQRLIDKYDGNTRAFLTRQYFYVHADIIKQSIKSVDTSSYNSIDIKVYKYINDSLQNILMESRNNFLLGFNPDDLMYRKMDNEINTIYLCNIDSALFKSQWGFYPYECITLKKGDRVDSLFQIGKSKYMDNQFNTERSKWEVNFMSKIIYHSLLLNYKSHILKIYKQAAFYYLGDNGIVPHSNLFYEINHMNSFAELIKGFDPDINIEENSATIRFSSFQTLFCNCINAVVRYIFLMLILISIAYGLINTNRNRDKKIYWFLLLHFLLVLTVAVIHTFDNPRYIQSIYIPAIFCYFLMIIHLLAPFRKEKLP